MDIVNLVRTKAVLSKNFHIQPSELEMMPVWEYELFIEQLNNLAKEENEQQKGEMDKYNHGIRGYNNFTKNASKMSTPSMPKMPSMNLPK
jgi:hypothetical protein